MGLESTQPLTKLSTRNLSGKERLANRRVVLTTSRASLSRLSTKCGSFDVSQPSVPPWSVAGLASYFLCIRKSVRLLPLYPSIMQFN
jgi:hypothetical protein